jgi:hypothetical protein
MLAGSVEGLGNRAGKAVEAPSVLHLPPTRIHRRVAALRASTVLVALEDVSSRD